MKRRMHQLWTSLTQAQRRVGTQDDGSWCTIRMSARRSAASRACSRLSPLSCCALRGRLGAALAVPEATGAAGAALAVHGREVGCGRAEWGRADCCAERGRDSAAISSLPSAACDAKLQSQRRLCCAARALCSVRTSPHAVCGRCAAGAGADAVAPLLCASTGLGRVAGAAVCGRAAARSLRIGLADGGREMSCTRMISRVADRGRKLGPVLGSSSGRNGSRGTWKSTGLRFVAPSMSATLFVSADRGRRVGSIVGAGAPSYQRFGRAAGSAYTGSCGSTERLVFSPFACSPGALAQFVAPAMSCVCITARGVTGRSGRRCSSV